ncbi:hypothetical protein BT63DRAFT_74621 [Microthyrium microscopicum]|uniref:DUF3533 domain-containing protein n=1 Tax=Microthyrium microscopicum TaxID=703497 RepID=A0A6A6U2C0_9PEZI|nr:hypothetical protein BT63DRAFT_74621 [Microthyrium microscopicum]
MQFYPRARENRILPTHLSFRVPRRALLRAATINLVFLQLLFLGLFCYIYGAIFEQTPRIKSFNVLYVDYDGGPIGASVRDAYKSLQANSFPTLIERSPSEFAAPFDLRREVCKTHYWAAVYTVPGASDRLQTALAGHSTAYNKSDVLAYIWNEARYATTIDSAISANIQTLSSTARVRYTSSNWTETVPRPTIETFSVLSNPWQLNSINIQPTVQGGRLIYNTLVIVLVLIQEFFYLGTLNGLYENFKIYARIKPHRIIIMRTILSAAYTFIGSLCVAGTIWAFRAGWGVDTGQFFLCWAVLWLFAHTNFLTLDVFTTWLPHPYVPMALISWVVINVTSILVPFELSPGFYRWAYLLPAHEVYQVLIDIWSRGCDPVLHRALPILLALEISGLVLNALGTYRRCHYATIKQEMEQKAMTLRVDEALALEREHDGRMRGEKDTDAITVPLGEHVTAPDDNEKEDREKAEAGINQADVGLQRLRSRTGFDVQFGPAFGFDFGKPLDSSQTR